MTKQFSVQFSSVQSLSHVQLFATPWIAARQASLSIANAWSLLKPMSVESVMSSNHLILYHPFLLLPSIFPRISCPKYWSFSFSTCLSKEYSGLISFRIDLFDLLAFQGTPRSLLQHHSAKASILWRSAIFIVQLSYSSINNYWKDQSLDYTDFVSKVMSLLFNTLSRFAIAFLPRSSILISWLPSASQWF